jgi:molybdopterin synthase sulfur carrier subunit
MKIKVRLFANFREVMGRGTLEIEEVQNLSELLEKLVELKGEMANELFYPGTREPVRTVQIMVNGKSVKLPQELDLALKDGDEVAIFPPVAGGQTVFWQAPSDFSRWPPDRA